LYGDQRDHADRLQDQNEQEPALDKRTATVKILAPKKAATRAGGSSFHPASSFSRKLPSDIDRAKIDRALAEANLKFPLFRKS
jgi:hypothetical protein